MELTQRSQDIDHTEYSIDDRIDEVTCRSKCLKWLPTKERVFLLLSQFLIICFVISIAYSVLQKAVLPGSEIFALSFLFLLSNIGGIIMKFIKLPPLLGMLIAGFLFRNLPLIPYYEDLSFRWISTLRDSALVVILLKAGIGLDSQQLKKLKRVVLQVAFIPCTIETFTMGIASHFILNLPWIWAILLGFVISAVSPAVVVPSMLNLQEKQYGVLKGIPTLMIAAASVDDILAITGFTIMLSISVSTGSWLWCLGKGVLEPFIGFIFGVSCGCILWYIPGKNISKASLGTYRIILLCCGGLAIMLSSKELDFAGTGPFGCLVLGFVAACRWKKDSDIFSTVEDAVSLLWKLLQPFLFSLIGCEVTIASLEKDIGKNIATLTIACVFRTLTAYIVTCGGGVNWKEKLFIAFAWIPKATVQAAVGSQALDYVHAHNKGPEMEEYAKKVLAVAVLSILLTAPLGAVLISILGPVLLTRDERETADNLSKIEEENLQLQQRAVISETKENSSLPSCE